MLPSGVVLQKDFLVLYRVTLTAVPVLVAHVKAGVKGCNFTIIRLPSLEVEMKGLNFHWIIRMCRHSMAME